MSEPNETNHRKIDDAKLVLEIRDLTNGGHGVLTLPEIADLLDELLRFRRARAADSRRAEQFRRMRWQMETLTGKCEELTRRIQEIAGQIEGETLDEIAARERDQELACHG